MTASQPLCVGIMLGAMANVGISNGKAVMISAVRHNMTLCAIRMTQPAISGACNAEDERANNRSTLIVATNIVKRTNQRANACGCQAIMAINNKLLSVSQNTPGAMACEVS